MILKVALFGPLFTMAERMFNLELKRLLEELSGGQVLVTLPQKRAEKFISKDGIDRDGIRNDCLHYAENATAAIANLDGPDSDSGTCVEIGYRLGYAKGAKKDRYVLGFRTDIRASEDRGLNIMLGVCDEIVRHPSFSPADTESLAEELLKRLRTRFQYLDTVIEVPKMQPVHNPNPDAEPLALAVMEAAALKFLGQPNKPIRYSFKHDNQGTEWFINVEGGLTTGLNFHGWLHISKSKVNRAWDLRAVDFRTKRQALVDHKVMLAQRPDGSRYVVLYKAGLDEGKYWNQVKKRGHKTIHEI
jgi:nucleoside 2-deoxyribosyltransferase